MISCRRPSSPVLLSLLLVSLLGLSTPTSPACAGSIFVPRMALHLLPVTGKNACERSAAAPACNAIVTRGDLYPASYFGYLLVTSADPTAGLAGLELGLEYNGAPHQGVDILTWVNCASLNFPQLGWPAAGTGNVITWDSHVRCQRNEPAGPGTGVVAAAGYFYLAAYSADVLRIVPRQLNNLAAIANCSNVEVHMEGDGQHHDPSLLGAATFSSGGGSPGFNPCADAPEPIPCLIGGPYTLLEGETGTFGAEGVPSGAGFTWVATGNATITGPSTDPTVTLLAGTPGPFDLSVVMTHAGARTECLFRGEVNAPSSSCLIFGETELTEGRVGAQYSATPSNPTDTFLWEVTGNAILTSDPTLPYARVNAGDPGACELTLHITQSGQPTLNCHSTVSIHPIVCHMSGPDPAEAYFAGNRYEAGPELEGASYDWQAHGPVTIHGSHQDRTVLIETGDPGQFNLELTISRGSRTEHCSRLISVELLGATTGPDAGTKLLIHLLPATSRQTCGDNSGPRCTSAVTAGGLFPSLYYAYLLAGDADATAGLSAIECGVDYDGTPHRGVDVFSWTSCVGTEVQHSGPNGPWPTPGSGNLVIWDVSTSCQRREPGGPGTGVVATAGYFYMAAYDSDQLKVVPSPPRGQALVLDCAVNAYIVGGAGFPPTGTSHLGFASFSPGGATAGFNPCGANVPVRVTTWSAIKGLYGTPAKPVKP